MPKIKNNKWHKKWHKIKISLKKIIMSFLEQVDFQWMKIRSRLSRSKIVSLCILTVPKFPSCPTFRSIYFFNKFQLSSSVEPQTSVKNYSIYRGIKRQFSILKNTTLKGVAVVCLMFIASARGLGGLWFNTWRELKLFWKSFFYFLLLFLLNVICWAA